MHGVVFSPIQFLCILLLEERCPGTNIAALQQTVPDPSLSHHHRVDTSEGPPPLPCHLPVQPRPYCTFIPHSMPAFRFSHEQTCLRDDALYVIQVASIFPIDICLLILCINRSLPGISTSVAWFCLIVHVPVIEAAGWVGGLEVPPPHWLLLCFRASLVILT